MEHQKDYKTEQCLNDMQKYEEWGNLLAGQCFVNLFSSNAPISALTIHNGMEYIKAKMKLSVLQDNRHSEEEKEKRLRQIDIDIHHTEEVMKNDLEYRAFFLPAAMSYHKCICRQA